MVLHRDTAIRRINAQGRVSTVGTVRARQRTSDSNNGPTSIFPRARGRRALGYVRG
jgi:hypothetical protein